MKNIKTLKLNWEKTHTEDKGSFFCRKCDNNNNVKICPNFKTEIYILPGRSDLAQVVLGIYSDPSLQFKTSPL